jgi:hypothetical protein
MADDMFDEIINRAKRIVNTSTAIASEMFPHGAVLHCIRCAHTECVGQGRCARYLSVGWPEHCGQTMMADRAAPLQEDTNG